MIREDVALDAVDRNQPELGPLLVQCGTERPVEDPLVHLPEQAVADRGQPLRILEAHLRRCNGRVIGRWKYRWAVGNEYMGNLERLRDRARRNLDRAGGDDEIAPARRLGQHLKLIADGGSGEL